MEGTLIDLIDRLSEVDQSDRYNPPCLYAAGGKFAKTSARARVCGGSDDDSRSCPEDKALEYVVMVQLAVQAISVWQSWFGRVPNRIQKFQAVMYYAQNDAFFPREG
jgi:hypothetical protein